MPSIFKRISPEEEVERQREDFVATEKQAVQATANSGEQRTFIAKTLQGLEGVLCDELEALGATGVFPLKRAVEFRGDTRVLYRANYEARTALRILVPIHKFRAYNEKNLYHEVRDGVDWTKLMEVNDTLAIETVAAGTVFRHSHYAGLVVKDGIVDQFRERFGRRPDVNTTSPTLRVHLRINNNDCDLLLDASGDSLHKRGYRRDAVEAPLNEVLAAGMILLSEWDANSPFADAMCGSGTLAIEAAMLALKMPIQHKRDLPFGFTRWKDFDRQLWKQVKAEADSHILKSLDFPILASDKDSRARNATAINVMSAGMEKIIQVERRTFEQVSPPGVSGTLMMNPPYDERLELDDALGFYQGVGDVFKKNWSGWNCWLISAHKEALKHLGLRPSRRIDLINGKLECSFQKFAMYAGSKKGPAEPEEVAGEEAGEAEGV